MELNVDKENEECKYNDEQHVYWNAKDSTKYTSVTTLIHNYTKEFDEDFWSSYKALESLLDEESFKPIKKVLLARKKFNRDIVRKLRLDEVEFNDKKRSIIGGYKEERDKSCERGTKIHADFENAYYKTDKHKLEKFGLSGEFTCRPDDYRLDLEKGIYPEFLIHRTSSDGFLRVAGQIDLLIKDGNDIYIYDYKTNKEIKTKGYYDRSKNKTECMKYPLNNIPDTNYWHYTLQLSLYAYLLKQVNPDFNIKLLKLIHVDHSNKVTEYTLEYLEEPVESMLRHFKKAQKVKEELDKLKPAV